MEALLSIIVGILSIVVLLLFLALVLGLIKPSIVLFRSNNPTRLKVGLYCLVGILGISFICDSIDTYRESLIPDKDHIKTAKSYLSDKDYDMANYTLDKVDTSNLEYKSLKLEIDSIEEAQAIEAREQMVREDEEARKIEDNKLISQLEKELASVNGNIDFSTYRGNLDALHLELALFGAWAQVVQDGEISNNPKAKKLASKLRTAIGRVQTKEFPKLRKEYGILIGKKVWENDIDVTTSGTGNKYMNITGGLFTANKNKKDFQEGVSAALHLFRFKQSRYKWYKGEKEYTYYKMESNSDSELVEF